MNSKSLLLIFASLLSISTHAMQTVQKQLTKPVTQYVTSRATPLLEQARKSIAEYLPTRTTPKTTPLSPALTTPPLTKSIQPKPITQPKKLTEKYTSYTTHAVPQESLLQKYLYTPSSITLNKLLAAGTTAGSFFGWFSADNKQDITQTEDGRYVSHLANMPEEKAKQELRNFLRNYPDSPTAVQLIALMDEPDVLKMTILVTGKENIKWKNIDALMPLLDPLMKKEEELNKLGYDTLLHGERWELELFENWYTKTWEADEEKKTSDFIFAHINKPLESLTEEETIRKQIIKKDYADLKEENSCYWSQRDHGLYMNAGLFYNMGIAGASTADYVINSTTERKTNFTFKSIFDCFGLSELYYNYQAELKQLSQEHAALNTQGNLLLIAIPKKIVEQCVTVTDSRTSIINGISYANKKFFVEGIGETNNIEIILDTLRTDPKKVKKINPFSRDDKKLEPAFNYTEFILAMTADQPGGRNPESGIKFFDFNTVDPKKMAAYKAKEAALLQQIHDDIVTGKKYPHVKTFTKQLHEELAP